MIEKISFIDYQCNDALNISKLKMMRKSPAHFRASLEEPRKETDDLTLGSAIHCLILEPKEWNKQFLTMPKIDRRTKEGKLNYDALIARADRKGLTLITEDLKACAEEASTEALKHPYSALFRRGQAELSMFWTADNGVACKGRLDHYDKASKTITDLKTTKDASPDSFAKSIYTYGYHLQAAWYMEGAKKCGLDVEDYIIFAIEKEAPYCCVAYRISPADIALAQAENERLLNLFADCSKTGNWYGYSLEIQEISLPAWAVSKTVNNFD